MSQTETDAQLAEIRDLRHTLVRRDNEIAQLREQIRMLEVALKEQKGGQ